MSVTLTRDEADEVAGLLRAYADGKPLRGYGAVNRACRALTTDGYGQGPKAPLQEALDLLQSIVGAEALSFPDDKDARALLIRYGRDVEPAE